MGDYRTFRQRFFLSSYAWDIIENDAAIFTNARRPSIAGMINLILELYMDDSEAAIENSVDRRRVVLREQLAELPDGETKETVIDTFLNSYIRELTDKKNSYPCEENRVSSLSEKNYLFSQKWRDKYNVYGESVSKLFKAVIEEYTRKSYYEREEIILQDLINHLTFCKDKSQMIRVLLKNGRKYMIRPYDICHDPNINYHYLVGMAKRAETDYKDRLVSFRLSGIKECRPIKEPSGRITAAEKQEIKQRLKNSGVQFLLEEQELIEVKLTETGKKNYESQFHLRPNYTDRKQVDGDTWLYTFECTPMQAEFYFFKFGADVEVIAPKSLRERFSKKYYDAYHKYDTK